MVAAGSGLLKRAGEGGFQFFGAEAQLEASVFGYAYGTGFFAYDDGEAVALLRDAQCGTVA